MWVNVIFTFDMYICYCFDDVSAIRKPRTMTFSIYDSQIFFAVFAVSIIIKPKTDSGLTLTTLIAISFSAPTRKNF